jgi:hypothetical protein
MITEPEMSEEPGPARPADVLDAERPSALAGAANRPWVWALGAVVATSAVWTAVLHGTGYGHPAPPDLHGYHLGGNPCGGHNLTPLSDALRAGDFASFPAEIKKGPALDEASCSLTASSPSGNGWLTTYTVNVTVELHKKTDPRVEFEDRNHLQVDTLVPADPGSGILATSGQGKVEPVPGLGDSAYLHTSGVSHQTLDALHGGAVFSLTIDASDGWNGPGLPPSETDGHPRLPDLGPLRPALQKAMRHLMGVLSG